MKNYTLYTTIDNIPIYRTSTHYFTMQHLRHSGGCNDTREIYLGISHRSVLRFFFKQRHWGQRFFSREMLYIFDQYLRATALPLLHPRC